MRCYIKLLSQCLTHGEHSKNAYYDDLYGRIYYFLNLNLSPGLKGNFIGR